MDEDRSRARTGPEPHRNGGLPDAAPDARTAEARPRETSTATLADLARAVVPDRRIASISNPEPALRRYNVLAVAPSVEVARRAVVDLERVDDRDDAVGLVVFGDDQQAPTGQVDPEHVTGALFPRILLGGLIGAVVGAIVIGGGAFLFGAEGASIGAALGGAAMFAVFGAVWATFARMGGSDAYRQTFVDAGGSDVSIVSLHTDDANAVDQVRSRLRDVGTVHVLGPDGTPA
jgi:hypothetical protein